MGSRGQGAWWLAGCGPGRRVVRAQPGSLWQPFWCPRVRIQVVLSVCVWLLLPSSRECSVLTVACCRRLYWTRSTEGVGLCVSFLSVPSRGPVTHGHFVSVCPKMKGCWGVLPAGAFRFEAAGLRAQTWCDLPVLEKPAFPWHGRAGHIRVGSERETGEGRSRAG